MSWIYKICVMKELSFNILSCNLLNLSKKKERKKESMNTIITWLTNADLFSVDIFEKKNPYLRENIEKKIFISWTKLTDTTVITCQSSI